VVQPRSVSPAVRPLPYSHDQPDNAGRLSRLGVARTIARHRYPPARAAAELRNLLDNPVYRQRASEVTLAELKTVKEKAGKAIRHASTGVVRNTLRHVTGLAGQTLDRSRGIGAVPAAQRVYQFKITLLDTRPPVWRRIQVKDCTLDKLHEPIQTAMGWTNSHLHHFRVGERLYGDPLLMAENFEEMGYKDSTTTKLSAILPKSGRRFRFGYECHAQGTPDR
jgi:hypothetical protein